ncbi:MAG: IclR family transcriptional regulator, partial [Acidimicrobiales bacterium]
MGSSVSGVGVVDKAMAILGAVEQSPRSLGELVEATGYSRATAHRLAVALEVHGLIRRDEDGRFTLGVRLIALGRAAAEGIPLAEAAMAALTRLRDETGESVQLYVREGDRRVCIAALESPHGLRTIVPMGASLPLDVGSAGAILSQPLGAESVPNRRRWAESVGEREAGVASVSAGVLDPDGD